MLLKVLKGSIGSVIGLFGMGYGYGYGCGYGCGYGSGSGYGCGYGSGYGYGLGDGYGSGYGSGYGYGYLAAILSAYPCPPGAKLAFWRSDAAGRPCNNGTGGPRHVGMVEELPGPLVPCRAGAFHATLTPLAWAGERTWIVAMYGAVVVDATKLAALKREIIAEVNL